MACVDYTVVELPAVTVAGYDTPPPTVEKPATAAVFAAHDPTPDV